MTRVVCSLLPTVLRSYNRRALPLPSSISSSALLRLSALLKISDVGTAPSGERREEQGVVCGTERPWP